MKLRDELHGYICAAITGLCSNLKEPWTGGDIAAEAYHIAEKCAERRHEASKTLITDTDKLLETLRNAEEFSRLNNEKAEELNKSDEAAMYRGRRQAYQAVIRIVQQHAGHTEKEMDGEDGGFFSVDGSLNFLVERLDRD